MASPATPVASVRWWFLTAQFEQRDHWRRVCLAATRRLAEPDVPPAPRPEGQGREDLGAAYLSFGLS